MTGRLHYIVAAITSMINAQAAIASRVYRKSFIMVFSDNFPSNLLPALQFETKELQGFSTG